MFIHARTLHGAVCLINLDRAQSLSDTTYPLDFDKPGEVVDCVHVSLTNDEEHWLPGHHLPTIVRELRKVPTPGVLDLRHECETALKAAKAKLKLVKGAKRAES